MRPLTKEGEKMKLQNMAVVFLIIVIPIIVLLSYYISLQVDTLNMQSAYNAKLLQSAKGAISAFEINTVEWNEAYSETADSKRRDIMASINTFIDSLANEIGTSGMNKEYILPYIPAIAYTLYDGYYIYSPSEVKEVIKDSNGVAVFISEDLFESGSITKYGYNKDDNGKVLYAYSGNDPDGYYNSTPFTLEANKCTVSNYSHVLKPFSPYSARYKKGRNIDITVNYTLDNYISICGKVNGDYITKSGYFIDTSYIKNMPRETWKDIVVNKKGNDVVINPEMLTEKIWYEGLNKPEVYNYVYASDNTKVYFDGNDVAFQVNSSGKRNNLNTFTSVKYKKLVILNRDNSTTEVYQALTDGIYRKSEYNNINISAGKWYYNMEGKEYLENIGIDIKSDVSSINYYVEAYSFTNWINNNLNRIDVNEDMVGDKNGISTSGKIFENPEQEGSVFLEHKREVIKQSIISSLNQAITSYSRNSEGIYRLPVLTETDWDQILRNVSIVVFAQNIPIGLKTYNNYAIATSTNNKEYVDPEEIYLNVTNGSDEYYHLPYCRNIKEATNLVGYRNIDYVIKSYDFNETKKYYYRHDNICQQKDYYCLVQRSLYEETNSQEQTRAYETALARERYVTHSFNK